MGPAVEEGHLVGAPIFRSPEGMFNLRWGTATDIWSFGTTVPISLPHLNFPLSPPHPPTPLTPIAAHKPPLGPLLPHLPPPLHPPHLPLLRRLHLHSARHVFRALPQTLQRLTRCCSARSHPLKRELPRGEETFLPDRAAGNRGRGWGFHLKDYEDGPQRQTIRPGAPA